MCQRFHILWLILRQFRLKAGVHSVTLYMREPTGSFRLFTSLSRLRLSFSVSLSVWLSLSPSLSVAHTTNTYIRNVTTVLTFQKPLITHTIFVMLTAGCVQVETYLNQFTQRRFVEICMYAINFT